MIMDEKNLDITEPPKVTIAIPTYNRGEFLTKALDSALAQSYKNIEVIVSDNDSTDNTLEILSNYNDARLTIIQHRTNLGMVGNWNACLNIASGKLFLLLSDDDFLEPTAIEKMANYFRYATPGSQPSKIGVVYCKPRIIDEDGVMIGHGKSGPTLESASTTITQFFLGTRFIPLCGTMMRTLDIRLLGGYDEYKFPLASDANIWMLIANKRGVVVCIDETLTNYRVHTSNETSKAGIRKWINENSNLAKMAIGIFSDQGDYRCVKTIRRSIKHFNARFISNVILWSYICGDKRYNAIRQHNIYAEYFFSLFGFLLLLKAVVKICLPRTMFNAIRKL